MNLLVAFFSLLCLIAVPWIGTAMGFKFFLAVVMPYGALAFFICGVIYRILRWAQVPVPFRIPLTGGQQKSLSYINNARFDNPSTRLGLLGRMFMEIFFFRSLFRNTKAEVVDSHRVVQGSAKWLWLGSLIFHWSLLIIVIRHSRFFLEPVPSFIILLQSLDGIFETAVPVVYITCLLFIAALFYLLIRRIFVPLIKQLSLLQDYFPLMLLLAIGITGILMRHIVKVDVAAVKELALGLVTLKPIVPAGIGTIFYTHLFLICSLLIYIPLSKLMHFAGVLMSPTRNMINNNRMKRHINPWNPEVLTHSYEEWEEEFKDKLLQAGIPGEDINE